MSDLLTFEQYRLIGLKEQHAEVDAARAIVSESYSATALRFGIPLTIETGKFRPKAGDPITIRADKVINEYPWRLYLQKYVPQHDRSFLSRAFVEVYTGYCDFLLRMYTPRFRTPSQEVMGYLTLLTQLTAIEKILREKWVNGPQAFAYPGVYALMSQCYQLREEYATRRHAINSLAKKYQWGEVRKEAEFLLLRREYRGRAETLRESQTHLVVEPLPSGTPSIILLPVGRSEHHVA